MEMTKMIRGFMVLALFASLPFAAFARNGDVMVAPEMTVSEDVEAPETQTRDEAMLQLESEADQDGALERPRDNY